MIYLYIAPIGPRTCSISMQSSRRFELINSGLSFLSAPSPNRRWPISAMSSQQPESPWIKIRWRPSPVGHSPPRCAGCVCSSASRATTAAFIKDYGTVAAPLTTLLKKEGFLWTPAATEAFDALKKALSAAPVLHLPDFDKTFVVDCESTMHPGRVLV